MCSDHQRLEAVELAGGVPAQAAAENVSLAAALDPLNHGVLQAALLNGLLDDPDALQKVVVGFGLGLVHLAGIGSGERRHVVDGPNVLRGGGGSERAPHVLRSAQILGASVLLAVAGSLAGRLAGREACAVAGHGAGVAMRSDAVRYAGGVGDADAARGSNHRELDRLLLELEELGLERGLRSCHCRHHVGQPSHVGQELVHPVAVGGALCLDLLELVVVLLVDLGGHALGRLGGDGVERRRQPLRQRGEHLLLHAVGNHAADPVGDGVDEVVGPQRAADGVRQGALNLLLNRRRRGGLQLVVNQLRHGLAGLVADGGYHHIGKLLVDQLLEDLLGVLVQDLRNHVEELPLVLVEALVPNASAVVDPAVQAVQRSLEGVGHGSPEPGLEARDGGIERFGREAAGAAGQAVDDALAGSGLALMRRRRRSVGAELGVLALLLALFALGLVGVGFPGRLPGRLGLFGVALGPGGGRRRLLLGAPGRGGLGGGSLGRLRRGGLPRHRPSGDAHRGGVLGGAVGGVRLHGRLQLGHRDDALDDGVDGVEHLVVPGPPQLGLLDHQASDALGVHGVELEERRLVRVLHHGGVGEDVQAAQHAAVVERILADAADDSSAIWLGNRGVLGNELLDVLGLRHALEVVLGGRQVREVDRVARGVADDDHAAGRVVHDAADGVGLLAVGEVELLDGLAQGQVPQLQGVVLLHADNHVPERALLLVRALLVEEQDGRRPGLFALRGAGQGHQRLLDLEGGVGGHGVARVRALLGGGQVADVPELDAAGLVQRDNDGVVLAKGKVLTSLASVDLEGALAQQRLGVGDAVVSGLEQVVLQDEGRPDEVDRLAAADGEELGVVGGGAGAGLEGTAGGVALLGVDGGQGEAVLLQVRIFEVILLAVLDLDPVDGAADAGTDDSLPGNTAVLVRGDRHGDVEDAVLGVPKNLCVLSIVLTNDTQATLLGHAVRHRDGDPRLHREVVDLDGGGLLLLDDDNLILVGALPAVRDAVVVDASGFRSVLGEALLGGAVPAVVLMVGLDVLDGVLLGGAGGVGVVGRLNPVALVVRPDGVALVMSPGGGALGVVGRSLALGPLQSLSGVAVGPAGEVVNGLGDGLSVLVDVDEAAEIGSRGRLLEGLLCGMVGVLGVVRLVGMVRLVGAEGRSTVERMPELLGGALERAPLGAAKGVRARRRALFLFQDVEGGRGRPADAAAAVRRHLAAERASQRLVENRHVCGILWRGREDGVGVGVAMAGKRLGRLLI
ncbi:hypothetical protein Trco_004559 [Trichoderma cornu-damae]|uniref:Uncharacterized protein n=1 Tax=Trichoderma cornu-damae TaxID=654480 RepID=A0A9P8QL13_9HYPO|nr:hypothetical protein Trco_004559 [Trichoderma cornu-damae]